MVSLLAAPAPLSLVVVVSCVALHAGRPLQVHQELGPVPLLATGANLAHPTLVTLLTAEREGGGFWNAEVRKRACMRLGAFQFPLNWGLPPPLVCKFTQLPY